MTTVTLILAALAAVCAAQEQSPPPLPEMKPVEILTQAKSALAGSGTIRARLVLTATYPMEYTSEIDIYSSPTGNERAEITSTQHESRYSALEVISEGILWTEQETPVGKVVSKIDMRQVKRALSEETSQFAAIPILGTNLLFDLGNLAQLIAFERSTSLLLDGEPYYVISGGPIDAIQSGKVTLPLGAIRYYSKARVLVRPGDFLPKRIELGDEDGKPALVLDFESIERNVEEPAGIFDYTPPEDAEVVDRTNWAIAQFNGA